MRLRALQLLVLSNALLGCGATHSVPQPARGGRVTLATCLPQITRILPSARLQAGAGNNGAPECHLTAGRVRAVVNLDRSPQPYMRLEREIVEDGQAFGTVRSFAPPQAVSRVGLDAAWLPDLDQLIAADRRVLLTVTVTGRGMRPAARRALAVRLARAYLR